LIEKAVWPVDDRAVLIDLDLAKGGGALLLFDEEKLSDAGYALLVGRRCSEAETINEVFAVSFKNALLVELCHREKEVGQKCLNLRVQVQLWLLKDKRGVRVCQQARDDDWQDLTDADADVRQVMRLVSG